MMRVEEVTDPSCLASYRTHWNGLVARSPDAGVFDTYEWLVSWIEAFWKNRPLRFLFFWDGETLQGIAPLLADERGDVWRKSSLVCPVNLHGNRANVLCSEDPAAVFAALFEHLSQNRRFPSLAFRNVLANTPMSTLLPTTAKAAGLASVTYPGIASPIIKVAGDWPSYLKSRSSHLAKEVKRKVKQMQAAGQVEVCVASHREQRDRLMQDMLHIEKRSWKEEKGVSLDRVPGLRPFYSAFAEAAAAGGFLKSYVLYLDSEPVAYVYGALFRNEYYAFRTAYDTQYRSLSPGIVIFERLLRDAFEEGCTVVDFGPGDDTRWKHDFANDVRTHVNLCVFSPWSMRSRCWSIFQQRLKPLMKKRLPRLVKWKNQLFPRV